MAEFVRWGEEERRVCKKAARWHEHGPLKARSTHTVTQYVLTRGGQLFCEHTETTIGRSPICPQPQS